jgi:uncharacterized membrane protein YadS
VLQLAVVLLGVQLSLSSIFVVGAESLPVMLSSLVVCFLCPAGLCAIAGPRVAAVVVNGLADENPDT